MKKSKGELQQKHYTKGQTDTLYRFFTLEILNLGNRIRENKRVLQRLAERQAELKRGKTELVRLRHELVKRSK